MRSKMTDILSTVETMVGAVLAKENEAPTPEKIRSLIQQTAKSLPSMLTKKRNNSHESLRLFMVYQ